MAREYKIDAVRLAFQYRVEPRFAGKESVAALLHCVCEVFSGRTTSDGNAVSSSGAFPRHLKMVRIHGRADSVQKIAPLTRIGENSETAGSIR